MGCGATLGVASCLRVPQQAVLDPLDSEGLMRRKCLGEDSQDGGSTVFSEGRGVLRLPSQTRPHLCPFQKAGAAFLDHSIKRAHCARLAFCSLKRRGTCHRASLGNQAGEAALRGLGRLDCLEQPKRGTR